uniref:Sideroflexin-4 n=1 Tax=Elaeophora elaphi TaxID=1147741 RepID=A0A0R3S3M2_9BILA
QLVHTADDLPVFRVKLFSNLLALAWDQSRFSGRLRYFITITDSLKAFASQNSLQDSKQLVELYRAGKEPHGTTVENLQRVQAFYLQTLQGRMSMMLWYKSVTRAVVFWQWTNQSFNALVNYTNRNETIRPISPYNKDLLVAYTSAVTGALGVAVGLKNYLGFFQHSFSPLFHRFVPLAAVAVANVINIPFTRQNLVVFSRNIIVAPSVC